ncbi:hypothetical protein PG985_001691 [Apiospora marii]|uniref:uncharacterized protein n=1 Tax=Apiospora marii TaxID=335849 RepID=UPI00312FD4C2
MDPSTVPKKWDLSLSIQSTKARCRREEMLRYCGQVPVLHRFAQAPRGAEHHVAAGRPGAGNGREVAGLFRLHGRWPSNGQDQVSQSSAWAVLTTAAGTRGVFGTLYPMDGCWTTEFGPAYELGVLTRAGKTRSISRVSIGLNTVSALSALAALPATLCLFVAPESLLVA